MNNEEYIYHFHAMRQVESGDISHNSGTLTRSRMISCREDFLEIGKLIAASINWPENNFTISSLTLLNPHVTSTERTKGDEE
jgi:hypothetical protein